jgi:murein L,D-transpeptidase YafK
MTKPKFTLALQYFEQFKKANNEKDKQYFYSQYMNEVFRVDKLYEEDDKKNKKRG